MTFPRRLLLFAPATGVSPAPGPAPGPPLFWLGALGGTTIAPLPFSLIGAIKAYWAANSLDATLAPIFSEGAPPSQDLPFIVIDGISDDLGGITDDDKQIDMFLTVWASSSARATTIARGITARFGNPTAIPTKTIDRDPFAWQTGTEKFAEPMATAQTMTPKVYQSTRAFRNYMHYVFFIEGDY